MFTIEGLKTGQVTLHLVQRRAWEKDKPALKEHVVVIVVHP